MKKFLFFTIMTTLLNQNVFSVSQKGYLSAPIIRDEGDQMDFYRLAVNSNTTVTPFTLFNWNVSTDSYVDGQQMKLRNITVQNPLSFEVLVASWSGFSFTDDWGWINKSSGSWTTFNSATFYLLLPPNVATGTVRIILERDK